VRDGRGPAAVTLMTRAAACLSHAPLDASCQSQCTLG
jgi:hypothetical protein